MDFLFLVLVGFAAVLAHWYNRYASRRTKSTFGEYLQFNKSRTIASLIAIFAATAGWYSETPEPFSLAAALKVFTTGYMLDSLLNKDKAK